MVTKVKTTLSSLTSWLAIWHFCHDYPFVIDSYWVVAPLSLTQVYVAVLSLATSPSHGLSCQAHQVTSGCDVCSQYNHTN